MLFAHRHLFALSWRAPPQLDASLRLYAISRSPARSTTSFSTSVQAESSLRLYENLRDKSSDATTLSSSAFTAATVAFSFAIAYRSGAAPRAQEIHAPHRSRSTDVKSRAGVAKSSHAPVVSKIDRPACLRRPAAVLEPPPIFDRCYRRLPLFFERRDRLLQRRQDRAATATSRLPFDRKVFGLRMGLIERIIPARPPSRS